MNASDILRSAVEQNASDIFMIPGMSCAFKIGGHIIPQGEDKIFPDEMKDLISQIYELAGERDMGQLLEHGDDDFSFSLASLSRFRASTFKQRGSLAAVIRVVNFELPDPTVNGVPEIVMGISKMTKGFVLITGPAGSGKSTTLACIIDRINNTRNAHVITLEDPLEYLHRHKKSVVSQREIITDSDSYMSALRSALRLAPDVILLGEMRDYETMKIAMTAAETGHLLLSTLHTVGAANTIDRIIDAFPPNQQQQIRIQLSMVLQAVVSQQLIPSTTGNKEELAMEIMFLNSAIRNMIRDSKIHQIDGIISTSQDEGMLSMDASLMRLYKEGKITQENAVIYSNNPELMEKKIKRDSQ